MDTGDRRDRGREQFTGWGFINLHKPMGWTSHDCVAKLRRLLRTKKIGHGGTLDPMATGVLPMAVGKATRLLQYLPKEKCYEATVRFGLQTTTDDLEGEAIATAPCPELTLEAITPHLEKFHGKITQIPPAFSAIQRDGKRLYELARQGIAVDVPSREVEIFGIQILGWQSGDFPELRLEIACGEGTYIRAIARDLGEMVGTGATLAGLMRTESAGFHLEHSLTLETITTQLEAGTFLCQSPNQCLAHLPALTLTGEQVQKWYWGQKLSWSEALPQESGQPLAIFTDGDRCLGIGEFKPSKHDPEQIVLSPKLVLHD